jgi:hypothetical protein
MQNSSEALLDRVDMGVNQQNRTVQKVAFARKRLAKERSSASDIHAHASQVDTFPYSPASLYGGQGTSSGAVRELQRTQQ